MKPVHATSEVGAPHDDDSMPIGLLEYGGFAVLAHPSNERAFEIRLAEPRHILLEIFFAVGGTMVFIILVGIGGLGLLCQGVTQVIRILGCIGSLILRREQ